jgi:hypothetical protein
MTTDIRAETPRQREGRQTTNFHAPAALDSYGRHFSRIGIASVAAAAAQVKQETAPALLRDVPAILRWDHDAA